jgi:hypothetical protein
MTTLDIRIEWHQPDQHWFAGFMRDGQSFILDGALVGNGPSPEEAVEDLMDLASALVVDGENELSSGPIDLGQRTWLFKLLDSGGLPGHEARYAAIRQALGHDPYKGPTS